MLSRCSDLEPLKAEEVLHDSDREVEILKVKIPEFVVRQGVTPKQLRTAGFEEYRDHWTFKYFLYEKLIYVMILISKEDLFCTARILRADNTGGVYAPFYNRRFGPANVVRDKVDERYVRLLRRLNRADVIEFVKEKK